MCSALSNYLIHNRMCLFCAMQANCSMISLPVDGHRAPISHLFDDLCESNVESHFVRIPEHDESSDSSCSESPVPELGTVSPKSGRSEESRNVIRLGSGCVGSNLKKISDSFRGSGRTLLSL